jgi:hypothetical protein
MGIAREPIKLYIQPLSGSNPQYIGLHGGLTHAEMVVPLIVA